MAVLLFLSVKAKAIAGEYFQVATINPPADKEESGRKQISLICGNFVK